MKILLTGAGGFVGRHVLADLMARGVNICIAARHPDKISATDLPASVIAWDMQQGGAGLYERAGRPDALLHLAWGGLPCYTAERHIKEELPMQYQFLRDLVREGLPRLVATGTCFEYGMQSGCLTEISACLPATCYGKAKLRLYEQLAGLQAEHPFEFTWARLFYMYGEGQAERALYPQLKAAVARGDKLFNMSGGEQLRDYLPITEAARLLTALTLDKRGHGVVNICSGKPVAVKQLVQAWLRENHAQMELNLGHYPYPEHEPMEFWGDRSKLDGLEGTELAWSLLVNRGRI